MIREYLPYFLQKELFGDRRRYGTAPRRDDPDWKRWLDAYHAIYEETQHRGKVTSSVNQAGYGILADVPLDGRTVAEIGPGGGYHLARLKGKPAAFHALDIQQNFLDEFSAKASGLGFPIRGHLLDPERPAIPLPSASVDVMLSFYSLEHLGPLERWLDEIFRVLKPGGTLAGAIPSEGGLAWGLGRWLTSRRVLKKRFGLDIRKIICWEHVNFCDDILSSLSARGELRQQCWPLKAAPYDMSLVVKFLLTKPGLSG